MHASSSDSQSASLPSRPRSVTSDPNGVPPHPLASPPHRDEAGMNDPTSVGPSPVDAGAPTLDQSLPSGEGVTFDADLRHLWSAGAIIADRYQLIEPVAAGAWGTVWQARQQGVDRLVAIKVLKSREGPSMQSARARFEREAKLASRIRHPSAVRIVEFGYESHHPFLVMEWLEGITLQELLRSCGALNLELVLEIGAEICAALHCAHEEGVIHRDLKPSNIMLVETSSGMTPVVVDFGLARTFEDDEPTVTRADVVIGTPAYMCPEAIRGHHLTPASDIYSLGVTLLEALLGANPFRGESGAESMTNHLMPRSIDHELLMAMGCSRTLAEMFLSMVALEQDERPPSIRTVESAFRAALYSPPPAPVELERPALDALQLVDTSSGRASKRLDAKRGDMVTWLRQSPPVLGLVIGLAAFLLFVGPTSLAKLKHRPPEAAHTVSAATPTTMMAGLAPISPEFTTALPLASPSHTEATAPSPPSPSAVAPARPAQDSGFVILPADEFPSEPPQHDVLVQEELETPPPTATPATVGQAGGDVSATETPEPPAMAPRPKPATASTPDAEAPPAAAPSSRRTSSRTSGEDRRTPAAPGTLVLTAAPPGRIFVNGKDHGLRSSLMLRDVPVGRYRVRIERDGEPVQRSIQLKSGERHVERF